MDSKIRFLKSWLCLLRALVLGNSPQLPVVQLKSEQAVFKKGKGTDKYIN